MNLLSFDFPGVVVIEAKPLIKVYFSLISADPSFKESES